jgi:2-C-methyl-D-erythritol 4-phosphate cytidylyltransferase
LISWTLEALAPIPFGGTVIAAPSGHLEEVRQLAGDARIVEGGQTRSASVRRAFQASGAGGESIVCIHDAARPFVTAAEAEAVLRAAEETGAAVAATPVADTIKRVAGGKVLGTVDRSPLWAAATPQAFRTQLLARALESGGDATDEAALCEALGIPVAVVAVSRLSFKITTPEDLRIAEAIVRSRK